jgi:hypothetical protein
MIVVYTEERRGEERRRQDRTKHVGNKIRGNTGAYSRGDNFCIYKR